ncbi:MAG: YihY/virulence factor BrkB family protein [Sedimentisphaerales bacterium]|nr:YihY/virulence factor BrkB family protein [Sedimentisphaerales bacterium]
MRKKIHDFFRNDIWAIRLEDEPPVRSFFLKPLRIVALAVRGFDEDKCMLRASSLTFYSLLSIVPVFAMVFGIAKGFGYQKYIEQELLTRFGGQQEVIRKAIDFSQNLLDNTRGGLIAGVGVIVLFWSVVKILGNIEKSFNSIWGVTQNRTLGRKFSDYLSFALICPILLIVSSSATVFINDQVTLITSRIQALSSLAPLILAGLQFLPYLVIWGLFMFIYYFMPNTRVRIRAALVAGILAGTLFQLVQKGYVLFQIGAARYNAVYGSFAALPLFLIWLQVSWLLVLFGAEISFAFQNVQTYEFEPDCLTVSESHKRLLSLVVAHRIIRNFCRAEPAWDADRLAADLEIPVRLVRRILADLTAAAVLTEIRSNPQKDPYYQPARDVQHLTVKSVIDALDRNGIDTIPVADSPALQNIRTRLADFDRQIQTTGVDAALKDL